MVPRRSAAYHLDGTMLRRLRIENLVLIHEAELAFAPGLNAITGETGAGKTILAQAIGLLLGAKGDAAYIGPDGAEAYVEAELDLPPGLLEEEEFESFAELRPEDEEGLLVARRVFADGRTRAYAWGRGAAREDLAAAGERLIAMSGQFEQRRLGRPSYQLDVLDSFIGDDQLKLRAESRVAWRELLAARRRHDELQTGAVAAEARLAELRALVEDTTGSSPTRRRRCAHSASGFGTSPSSQKEPRQRPTRSLPTRATVRPGSLQTQSARLRRSSRWRRSSRVPATSCGTPSCACGRRRVSCAAS